MYPSTGTFSMQTVLNQPLDPNLRKRILQEIKSPLLQQSFAMTNDDSFLSQSYTNPPKRPNIPPPTYSQQHHHNQSPHQYSHSKRPNITKTNFDNKSWQLSESFYDFNQNNRHYHQSYRNTPYEDRGEYLKQGITNRFETSISDFNKYTFQVNNNTNNKNKSTDNKNERSIKKAVQSIVSPLDPSITQRIQDEGQRLDIWSQFCGTLFNTRQQARNEFEWEKMRYERKKIFDAKGRSLLEKMKHDNNQHAKQLNLISRREQSILIPHYRPSHISLKDHSQLPQISQQLKQLNLNQVILLIKQSPNYHNKQLSQFINLICQIIQLLRKAETDKKLLLQNMELVYQLTTSKEDLLTGLNIAPQQQLGNFLERMNFTSLTDMIRKLSKTSLLQRKKISVKEYQQEKNKVGEALERMLGKYEEVERLIEGYVGRKGSVEGLRTVHRLIVDKFKIAYNSKSTLQLLQRVLNDLKLYRYLPQVHFLEYIWSNFYDRVLSEQQFIGCVVRVQGVYHSKEGNYCQEKMLETLGRISNNNNNNNNKNNNTSDRLSIELQRMGYERNY